LNPAEDPVNDTVRNRKQQVTGQMTPEAQDNTRIEWAYPGPLDDNDRNGDQEWKN
jgi:hypothetical protein